MYIGNILLIYRTKCTLSRTKIHAQNKSDKIVFFQTARHTLFGKKNDFVTPVFRAYLDYNYSDIYIGNIRLIYRTNCALSRTKKTHAKQVGYFRLIYRTNSPFGKKTTRFVNHVFWAYLNHNLSDIYGAPFGKKLYVLWTMLFESKQAQKNMVHKTCSFFPNGEFVRYISRKYPTCFCVCFFGPT